MAVAGKLVRPTEDLKDAFLEMIVDYRAAGEEYYHHRTALLDFRAFLGELEANSLGLDLEPGYVPMTTFWLVESERTLGESRLRHFLSPQLMIEGGHIGYAVRPSERGMGYGTLLLQLTLAEAHKLGLERVLITCDEENLASRHVIENNGGVLSGREISTRTAKPILQFWIEL